MFYKKLNLHKIKFLIFTLIFSIVLMGCGSSSNQQPQKDPGKNVKTIPLTLGTVTKNSISSGDFDPINEVIEISKTGGTVTKINFKNGDFVKEGDIILELENQDIQSNFLKTQATHLAKSSDFKSREITFKKFKKLRAERFISEDEFLLEESRFNSSKSDADTAHANYLAAKKDYEDLIMKAKISGVLANLDEKLFGEVPKNKEVFTVVDSSKMFVRTSVGVSEIFDIKVGNTADIFLANSNNTYKGEVYEVNPVADPVSKKYAVKVIVDNPNNTLKKGMFSRVTVHSGEKEGFIVPKDAIIVRDLFSFVFIAEEGIAREIRIDRGYSNGDFIEILSPELKSGMELIVQGQYILTNRDSLNILNDNNKNSALNSSN